MRNISRTILALAGIPAAACVVVFAQETKLPLKDLPQPVQQAARAEEANGATLKGFAKEVEGGKTFYEVETALKGHSRDLLFDGVGHLVEVEEEMANDPIPPAAMKALTARGRVTKVESVTKGKSVTYESVVKTKTGKNVEVAVDADGKAVKP